MTTTPKRPQSISGTQLAESQTLMDLKKIILISDTNPKVKVDGEKANLSLQTFVILALKVIVHLL